MNRPSKLHVFLLAGALFVICAVAFIGVDCGSDVGCAANKFALGYILIGLVAVFAGAVVWSSRAPAIPLVLTPIPAFPPISIPRTISTRAPPPLL
jgi:hypothetical protein